MAELMDTTDDTLMSTCCPPQRQAECCEPPDKAECCSSESSSCACSAGSVIVRARKPIQDREEIGWRVEALVEDLDRG